MAKSSSFSCGSHVVYPAHGVGKIKSIETHTIGDHSLEMFVISFEKDRMTLRLPVPKAKSSGLRPVCTTKEMASCDQCIKVRGRVRRTMWNRRVQEYEAKINSGDPVSISRSCARTLQNARANQTNLIASDKSIKMLSPTGWRNCSY